MWIGYSNCIGFSYRPKGKHFQLLFNSVLPWSLFSLYIFCNGCLVKGLCSYGEYKNDCWFSYNANSIHINTGIMTYIHYITVVLGRFRNTLSIIDTLYRLMYKTFIRQVIWYLKIHKRMASIQYIKISMSMFVGISQWKRRFVMKIN